MAGLFGAAWALSFRLAWLHIESAAPWLMAALGLGLVYSMARVYRLQPVRAWNTWRTPASFFLSAAVLGAMGVNLSRPGAGWALVAMLTLAAEIGMSLTKGSSIRDAAGRLRVAMLVLGWIGWLLMAVTQQKIVAWLAIPVFSMVLGAEAIGRWQFYASR